MPEVRFQLEWPDGKSSTLYSPSTVILDYFRPGDSMLVSELEARGVEALRAASERVRARYGFACTRTDEEESQLLQWVSRYSSDDTVRVTGQLSWFSSRGYFFDAWKTPFPSVHPGDRPPESAHGGKCMEQQGSRQGFTCLHRRQRMAKSQWIHSRSCWNPGLFTAQMGQGAGLQTDQRSLGLQRQPYCCSLSVRVARLRGAVVQSPRQWELGVCWERIDAPTWSQHQWCSDRWKRPPFHLGWWPTSWWFPGFNWAGALSWWNIAATHYRRQSLPSRTCGCSWNTTCSRSGISCCCLRPCSSTWLLPAFPGCHRAILRLLVWWTVWWLKRNVIFCLKASGDRCISLISGSTGAQWWRSVRTLRWSMP